MTLWLFVGALVLAAALLRLGRWRELHHGYAGLAIGMIGAGRDSGVLLTIGLALLWDDALQHAVQVFYAPFVSPLHWLYGVTLYRLAIVRRLNAWLDRTFA